MIISCLEYTIHLFRLQLRWLAVLQNLWQFTEQIIHVLLSMSLASAITNLLQPDLGGVS